MALPAGFNPNDMSFGNITKRTPVIEIPRNTSTYTSYGSWGGRSHESLWSRFNNGVASIGNWFAEKAEDVLGWFSLAAMAIIVITCIVKVISTWIDDGFWMALLMAIGACIVGVIAWYIAAIVIVIGVNVIMYGFRFLFWNGWTLLIALTIGIGGWAYASFGTPSYHYAPEEQTEVYTPTYDKYRCTAKVLNVRIHPNENSNVVGTLRKGQEVEVIDTENGFAAIEYNGNRRYVSLKYLNKINN